MIKNIIKYKFNKNFLINFLFNIFPLIILLSSGYINIYIAFFIIYGYKFLFSNKIKIRIFFFDYLILIFFILSIVSTIVNYGNSDYIILAKSIADIRFAFLFLLIRNLFHHEIIKINTLLILSTFCTIFVSLDIFLQFTHGKDILGYPEIDGRYGGIFGKEAIAGSYIQKLSILVITLFFYLKLQKKLNNNILIILIIFVLGAGILMTLDRMPFFIYIFSLLLLLILLKGFRKIISLSLLIIILFFTIMYKYNDRIYNRFQPINKIAQIVNSQIIDLTNKDRNAINKNENFKEKTSKTGIEYFALYNSAFYVLKDSFWIGSGTKSYYKKCHELSKNKQDLLCAPHPHNLYLEILINQGITGFILFSIFLFFLFKKYFLYLTNFRINTTDRLLKITFLIILIAELWPLRSYGSIFQTVNGSIFWFILALISSNKYSLKSS
jgi:O-antigen ligase